jgi:putative ABC transport system ATP-binding protein
MIQSQEGDEARRMDIVTMHNVKKYFGRGPRQVRAIDGVSLSIEKSGFTAIVGASGSGKTTLLNLIGGLYEPTEGAVIVDGINLAELSEEQLTVFRRRKVGFVFQDYNLVPELTIRENILFPLALDDSRPDPMFFTQIVEALGLKEQLDRFPYMLSGGGQQCAAIARALITKPSVILADEPTGSFDARTSQNVAGLLKMTAETFRQTLIMITHNQELAQLADRVVRLQDGRVVRSV